MKVLFVCTGNTCRSPMAHALYNLITNSKRAHSAGLFAQENEPANPMAKLAVERYGASLDNHKAHTITLDDIDESDIIITMTQSHKKALENIGYGDKTVTLFEFAGGKGDVTDPYGKSEEVYAETAELIYDLIKKGIENTFVRYAKEEDAEIIFEMEKNIFPDGWSENAILREIKNKKVLVAEKNDEILGYCIFMQAADEGEILRIATGEKYRKQGIGEKLLKSTLGFLKQSGAQSIYLEVRSKNTDAINLYKKMGFEEIDIRRNYYHDDDALIFKLELGR